MYKPLKITSYIYIQRSILCSVVLCVIRTLLKLKSEKRTPPPSCEINGATCFVCLSPVDSLCWFKMPSHPLWPLCMWVSACT